VAKEQLLIQKWGFHQTSQEKLTATAVCFSIDKQFPYDFMVLGFAG